MQRALLLPVTEARVSSCFITSRLKRGRFPAILGRRRVDASVYATIEVLAATATTSRSRHCYDDNIMPGRVARGGRSSANSAASRKTSTQSARNSSPIADTPDEGADSSLRRAVCTVFSDAQKSTAGHRKAIIALRKVQEACCYEPVNLEEGKAE